jgi:hypothetical protein
VNTLLACSSETGSSGKTARKWHKEEKIPDYPTHTKKKKTAIVLHRKTQNSKTNGKPHLVLANAISRERTGNRRAQNERREGMKKWMMAIQGNWFYTCRVVSSGPSVHPSSHAARSRDSVLQSVFIYPAVSLPRLPGLKDLQIKHVK